MIRIAFCVKLTTAKAVPKCELLNYLVAQKSAGFWTGALFSRLKLKLRQYIPDAQIAHTKVSILRRAGRYKPGRARQV